MTAKCALQHLLDASSTVDHVIRYLPLLIVVTHCDHPDAMSIQEIHDALNLTALKCRAWRIQGVDLIRGDDVRECRLVGFYCDSKDTKRVEGELVDDNRLFTQEEHISTDPRTSTGAASSHSLIDPDSTTMIQHPHL